MKNFKIWTITSTGLYKDKVGDQLTICLFSRVPSLSDNNIIQIRNRWYVDNTKVIVNVEIQNIEVKSEFK